MGSVALAHPQAPEDHRLGPLDLALILLLLVFVAWYVHAQVDLGGRPEEDAAMLLRYSKHFAEGRGIVWNVGEPPVDGATDFLATAERGVRCQPTGTGGRLRGDQVLELLSLAREHVRQHRRRRTGDRAAIELQLVPAAAAIRAFRPLHGQVLRHAKEGQGSTGRERRKGGLYRPGGGRRLPGRAGKTRCERDAAAGCGQTGTGRGVIRTTR